MRYETWACDVPECGTRHTAKFGDGHPGWAVLKYVALTDGEGRVVADEVVLCPEDRVKAATTLLGPPQLPKET